jgi:TPP-dependent pyruvate/acetoin dehydrogenase alpha subunit
MWKTQRDPITLLGNALIKENVADKARLDAIQKEVESEVAEAVKFAVAAPYPAPNEVDQDIYA